MISMTGVDLNPVLTALKLTEKDRIIAIKEKGIADSNFVLTHIMKKIFNNNEKLCLVTLHNSIDHYQLIGKKLGYDLSKKLDSNDAKIVDVLNILGEMIVNDNFLELGEKEQLYLNLFGSIKIQIEQLTTSNDHQVYLILDDISHLLDLGISLELVIKLITYFVNFKENVSIVINTHISNYEEDNTILPNDIIISNYLSYISDLIVEVNPLKTGRSTEVSGVLNIKRDDGNGSKYHYKAFDRGIKTFLPGDSLLNLYK